MGLRRLQRIFDDVILVDYLIDAHISYYSMIME